jgi:transcriptional regulator with XRE-family HTH domain
MNRRAGVMLLEARRGAGLTQAELAVRAGVARSAVSMYESGAREPGADVFLRLLTAAGVAVESGRPTVGIDCWRNSQVFTSLTSILGAVPIRDAGPLKFPAHAWRRAR